MFGLVEERERRAEPTASLGTNWSTSDGSEAAEIDVRNPERVRDSEMVQKKKTTQNRQQDNAHANKTMNHIIKQGEGHL
jgi:hypothetical protein